MSHYDCKECGAAPHEAHATDCERGALLSAQEAQIVAYVRSQGVVGKALAKEI